MPAPRRAPSRHFAPRPAARRFLAAAAALLLASVAAACARPGPPPGGTPDKAPPRVVATVPEALAVVPDFSGKVEIHFDERLSEKGFADAVLVSPATGAWDVHRHGGDVEVEMANGWKKGVVYRILVRPTVQDLFGNALAAPFELVFSTGPEIPATVLGGLATDRLTGSPVPDARIEAVHLPDSTTYVDFSDQQGVWVMRHIPLGDYLLRAYLDQNRNRALDGFEPRDSITRALTAADTSFARLSLLANDTTPANVTGAELADSVDIRVKLDKAIPPDVPLAGVIVQVFHLPDSVQVPVSRVLQEHVFKEEQDAARERALKQAAASARAAGVDTARAGAAETARAAPPRAAPPVAARPDTAAADTAGEPAELLPVRDFIVRTAAPLAPRTRYRVLVSGITTIYGIPGGGGNTVFTTPAPPAPKRPPADSAGAAAPDTAAADTTGRRPRPPSPLRPPPRSPPRPPR